MGKQLLAVTGLFMLLTCAGKTASAQLTFTFTPDTLTGAPGDTLTFSGTLTNTSGSSVYINSDSPTLIGLGLTLDDSPFALNAPMILTAGGTTGTIDLFNVSIDPATTFGSYPGSFSILGGAASTSQDFLVAGNFTVVVAPAVSNTPEPGPLALVGGVALSGIGFAARRRRRAPRLRRTA